MNALWAYLTAINLITFAAFGIDKYKAVRGRWRVPVATLLLLSLIGGSLGGLAGMHLFRHKTKKALFRFGLPVMLLIQIAIVACLKFSGTL